MKKLLSLFTIISIILIGGIIFADSNGIWHRAEDVQGGTFGADEMDITSYYRFIHPVYFDQNIELRNATLNITGSIFLNGTNIATLDSSGKVKVEQLPFHKGDLLAPENRQSDVGLLDEYYFNLTNLAILGVSASNVKAGIKFGLNNSLTGTAICGTVYYSLFGENSPTGTNYCIKTEVINSNSDATSIIVQTAGICKYISSCNLSSQSITNYPDLTSCGGNDLCQDGGCYSYTWQSGAWGACSLTCGGGTQTRSVSCQRNDGAIVSDGFCVNAGTKPVTSQSCNTEGCTFWKPAQDGTEGNWVGTPWNTYSYGMGGGSGSQCRTHQVCDLPSSAMTVTEYVRWYDHGFFSTQQTRTKPAGTTCHTSASYCVHQGGLIRYYFY